MRPNQQGSKFIEWAPVVQILVPTSYYSVIYDIWRADDGERKELKGTYLH